MAGIDDRRTELSRQQRRIIIASIGADTLGQAVAQADDRLTAGLQIANLAMIVTATSSE